MLIFFLLLISFFESGSVVMIFVLCRFGMELGSNYTILLCLQSSLLNIGGHNGGHVELLVREILLLMVNTSRILVNRLTFLLSLIPMG